MFFVPPPPWLSKTMSISSLTFYKKRRYRSQKEEKKHFSFPYENNIELLWSFAKSGCQFLLVTWLVSRKLQSTLSTSVKLCKLFYLYIGVIYISNIFSSLDRLFLYKKNRLKKGKTCIFHEYIYFNNLTIPIDTLGFVICLSLTHFWGDNVRIIFCVSVHKDYSLLCNDLESIS